MKKTNEFSATDDAGNSYTLIVYTDFTSVGIRRNPGGVIPGQKELRTSTGEHVNWLAKGEYQLVVSGIRLHSTDLKAE